MADLARIVRAYTKIRDRKRELKREFDAEDQALTESMDKLKAELLKHCVENGVEGARTAEGTFSRRANTKYWTSDWEQFYAFVQEHNMPELLEKRISQKNMRQLLADSPELVPRGLQQSTEYTITITKSKKDTDD